MVPSKVFSLVLLAVNGQWDGRVQMVAGAIICALMAVALSGALLRLFGRAHRAVILSAVGCYSALPYAWENTTWGFNRLSTFWCIGAAVF